MNEAEKRLETEEFAVMAQEATQLEPAEFSRRYESIYLLLGCAFSVMLVLTNMIGLKLFQAPFFPSFALPAGIIAYPLTFIITDVVSELYGQRRADRLVAVGFVMSLLMLVLVQIAMALPAHPAWVPGEGAFYETLPEYQHAYRSVFSLGPTLVVASMTAYLLAQLCDNRLFHFWKKLTKGRHLWLRNNGSTMISQWVDSLVVGSILFLWGMGMEFGLAMRLICTNYLFKLVIAALDTPLVYAVVFILRRYFGFVSSEGTQASAPR